MRIEFHKFTELATGKPVIVNPSKVRCIRQADAAGHALIEFGDGGRGDRQRGRCGRGAHQHPISKRGRAKARRRCMRPNRFSSNATRPRFPTMNMMSASATAILSVMMFAAPVL